MALPETKDHALRDWDTGLTIEAIHIGKPGANQSSMWKSVFDVLRAMPDAPDSQIAIAGRTGAAMREGGWKAVTMQHFEALCFKHQVGFPGKYFTVPASTPWESEIEECNAVRAIAYNIIRDGFKLTIQQRRGAGALPAMVRKP